MEIVGIDTVTADLTLAGIVECRIPAFAKLIVVLPCIGIVKTAVEIGQTPEQKNSPY
jgi:hypothetical protein